MSLPLITAPHLSRVPHLRHGFTTREGGESVGPYASLNLGWDTGDDDDVVERNYERLAVSLGTSGERLAGVRQVHETHVVRIDKEEELEDVTAQTGDALITQLSNAFLTVRVADCLPILIADVEHHAVGAVHAGWRGTLAGVLLAAIRAMKDAYSSNPAKLFLALGPAISKEKFEVGSGVADLFRSKIGLEEGEIDESKAKPHLDLVKINVRLARSIGIADAQIWKSGLCTVSDATRFFSFRRDGKHSGRMVGVIGWTA